MSSKKNRKDQKAKERLQNKLNRQAQQQNPGGGSVYAKKCRKQEQEYYESIGLGHLDL